MTLEHWKGRVDSESCGDSRRWHQIVEAAGENSAPGIAILGFACDEGIRRNGGRAGAADGPRALRKMLSNLPVLDDAPLYDAGDVQCLGTDLEGAQAAFASQASKLLDAGHFIVGIGGGHEIAYASFRGLTNHLRDSRLRLAIINFDAHFDLREQDAGSSGTPFLQALRHADAAGMPLTYICLGVSRSANTRNLFDTADSYGVHYRRDDQLGVLQLSQRALELDSWLREVDGIYMTICLDVLPAGIAPGVSAPGSRGVSLEVIEPLMDLVLATGKVKLCDVAELSPPYDHDFATARIAARLVHRIAAGISHNRHAMARDQSRPMSGG